MNSEFLVRLARMVALLAVQVLILNNVHLFSYATPLLIGYMLVCLHTGTSRVAALLWGFAIGLCFDMFSDTAGMASSACTLVAMIQAPTLAMFAPRDANEDFVPTYRSLGFWTYSLYVFVLMLVLHGVFYLLDAFSLSDMKLTLLAVLGGTALSTVLVLITELLVRTRKDYSQ